MKKKETWYHSGVAMKVHIEERRAWVRTHPHTVVRDMDPDYPLFRHDPTGTLMRTFRLWLLENGGRRGRPAAYLGSVELCGGRFSRDGLSRVFRRVSSLQAKDARRRSRRELGKLLRERRSS